MTAAFKDNGGVDRAISEILFKDNAGVDREISTALFGPKVIFSTAPDLTVVVNPETVGGDAGKTGHATTDTATAVPTGGTAPYTYLWSLEDVLGGSITIDSPTTAATTFSASTVADGDFWTATGRCTVTDADAFSASGTCSVTFYGGF